MAVAARSLREGFDAAHGGMYEAGVPGAPPGVGKGARAAGLELFPGSLCCPPPYGSSSLPNPFPSQRLDWGLLSACT
jgi:hypothetical protein